MHEALRGCLADFGPRILFAYLFGSTGTPLENARSDLDVAVYFDLPAEAIELDHKLLLYAGLSRVARRNDIDVVVLNICKNEILLYEILTKGQVVYDIDFEARAVFEQRTLHAAIDFKEQRDRIFA